MVEIRQIQKPIRHVKNGEEVILIPSEVSWRKAITWRRVTYIYKMSDSALKKA